MKNVWTVEKMPRLDGKVFVVTGANSGIGFEAARMFAGGGAHVVMACRSQPKTDEAIAQIRAQQPGASLEFMALDLSDLSSVRTFASDLFGKHAKIDVLCNNAGVMALPYRKTADGFEMQFGTNHLGHFALTGLLLERVLAGGPSRIVNVASTAHRMGKMRWDDLQWQKSYSKWSAYGQSKLSNLLFSYELDRRLRARNLDVMSVACHPGYASTNLQFVGPRMEQSSFLEKMSALGNKLFAQSQAMGALPTVYAATAEEVHSGDYIGPGGFLELAGYPKKVASNARSHDEAAARKLWEMSEALTGVRFTALDDKALPATSAA